MLHRRVAFVVASIALLSAACGAAGASSGASAGSGGAPSAGPVASPSKSPSTASVGQSAIPSSEALRVVGLDLRADPAESVGRCPLKITFSLTITVAGGGGTVSYRWKSSDGDISPLKTVSFTGPGAKTVSSTWTVDATTVPTHAGWSSIELVDPTPGSSGISIEPAAFAFTCPKDNDVEAIGFGIGGSDADCSIAKHLSTFEPTDAIRMVADYRPSLQAGTIVTFSLTRDGVLIDGYPVTTRLQASSKCVRGNVSNGHLATGHYRLDVAPDTARAIVGEFDVR